MSMRIQTNVESLNAYRNLNSTNRQQSDSMEKLSSGFRINRAADDAAGLAISEKMRGQISGLNQATSNAQDATSLIQTAEGALNESHEILQRMRELANQAANDTNTAEDRAEIQEEINQLTSELNRIGNTTEFNTKKLLDGGGVSRLAGTDLITDGSPEGGETHHTNAAQAFDLAGELDSDEDGGSITLNVQGEVLTINLEETDDTNIVADTEATADVEEATANEATVYYGDDTVAAGESAEAITDAINAIIEQNETLDGNYAATDSEDLSTTTDYDNLGNGLTDYTDNTDVSGNEEFAIYALSEDEGGQYFGDQGFIGDASSDEPAGSILTADPTAQVGTTEHYDARFEIDFGDLDGESADDLIGTGFTVDGEQFEFYNANDGAYDGGAIGINISNAVDGDGDIEATGADGDLADTVASQLDEHLDSNENVARVESNDTETEMYIIASADGEDGNSSIDVQDGGRSSSFSADFQIGANTGQSLTLNVDDMRAAALEVSSNEAGGTIDVGDGLEASFTEVQNVTDGTTNQDVEYALDVSEHDKATAAISVLDSAIEEVSSQRSELGAVQNRLEHTVANLEVAAENLEAAESRIRDVDMASEMMEFSKTQILEEAGTAMLAQANMAPQSVLQLLG